MSIKAFLNTISFDDQWVFFLLVIPLLLLVYYLLFKRKLFASIKHSGLGKLLNTSKPWRAKVKSALPAFKILSLTALIIALARPQSQFSEEKVTTEGIDIVLSMDVSASMLAKDFKPNRLESAKEVASEFIAARPNDRVGLVVFSGESFTQCPLTTDQKVLQNQLKGIKQGLLEDGTAIGEGIATSVSRLKESEAKSKVVILLTDGVSNRGVIDPMTAADLSLQYGIRVYTIGVGTNGTALTPYGKYPNGDWAYAPMPVEIDESTLKEVAKKTGGRYFRATDEQSLRQIYAEIDKLEKTRIEVASFTRKSEEFYPFAWIAGVFFLMDLLFHYTLTRSLP